MTAFKTKHLPRGSWQPCQTTSPVSCRSWLFDVQCPPGNLKALCECLRQSWDFSPFLPSGSGARSDNAGTCTTWTNPPTDVPAEKCARLCGLVSQDFLNTPFGIVCVRRAFCGPGSHPVWDTDQAGACREPCGQHARHAVGNRGGRVSLHRAAHGGRRSLAGGWATAADVGAETRLGTARGLREGFAGGVRRKKSRGKGGHGKMSPS